VLLVGRKRTKKYLVDQMPDGVGVMKDVREWQNWSLDKSYAMVYLDVLCVKRITGW